MKDAENAPSTNVPRHAVHWPIFQISHQRSRYVYELYYEKEAISKELYEYLLKNGYADKMLIAKWKKTGYEKVCLDVLLILCWLGKETDFDISYAASAAFRRKRRTSTLHAYAASPKRR